MSRAGYIKLYREAMHSYIWSLPGDQFKVAMTCLMRANWKEGSMVSGGERVAVPRGSFVTSSEALAKECGVTRQTIRTSLRNLEAAQFLTKNATKRYTMISIVNFDTYQSRDAEANQEPNQATNQVPTKYQPSTNQQLTTIEEGKNNKNCSASASRPRSKAPDGYQEFIEHFDRRYREVYGGAKPTWGKRQGAQVKRLLKAHGLDECRRRIDVLFDGPPSFIKTRDIGTLEQHFDKLVPQQVHRQLGLGATPGRRVLASTYRPGGSPR